jgi:hypothetical protein
VVSTMTDPKLDTGPPHQGQVDMRRWEEPILQGRPSHWVPYRAWLTNLSCSIRSKRLIKCHQCS